MFIFYYVLLCILGKMGNKRFPVCLNTLTHKSLLLGLTLPLSPVEFCLCGFAAIIMELRCIWNGSYSADFVSWFDMPLLSLVKVIVTDRDKQCKFQVW